MKSRGEVRNETRDGPRKSLKNVTQLQDLEALLTSASGFVFLTGRRGLKVKMLGAGGEGCVGFAGFCLFQEIHISPQQHLVDMWICCRWIGCHSDGF